MMYSLDFCLTLYGNNWSSYVGNGIQFKLDETNSFNRSENILLEYICPSFW